MLVTLKRLSLGLLLIVGASALLLFSDLRSRVKPVAPKPASDAAAAGPKPARHVRVALLQHASQMILDQGREGMLAALAEKGWVKDENLELKYYNAEGDMAVAQNIAKEMAGGGYDLLLTISTVSLQAVGNANKAGKTPHVFGLVTDPYGAGLGISRENHLDHPAHLAGYGTMQPIALAFKTAREMNPSLKTVGVVWNAAEANSEAQVKLARKVCAELGITLLESTIDNSAGVAEAAGALVARGVEALWVGGDVTVMSAIDSVIAAGKRGHIPVFTVVPPNAKRGALFDIGADYVEVGRTVGLLAAEILAGRNPATVSIENVMPEVLAINQMALVGLKEGWTVPAAHLARAQLLIDADGITHTKAASAPAAAAAPSRTMRVALFQHASQPALDEGRDGVVEGLADRGWVEGRNLELRRFNAQGDMAVSTQIAREMVAGGYDLLLTLTTPSTQAVANANQAGKTRHLFGLVNDPYSAGIGAKRDAPLDHPAHLAGYGSLAPVARSFQVAREMNPALKTVGVVWNPAEANSEAQLKLARAACTELGIKLEETTVENSAGTGEAAAALVSRGVEAIWAPGDGSVMSGLEPIIAAAKRGHIPVFSVIPTSVKRGTLFDLGASFADVGRLTGQLAGEVLNGRDTAKIPIENVVPELLMLNRQATAGLSATWTISAAQLARAQLVIDEQGVAQAKPRARPADAAPKAVPGRSYNIGFAAFSPEPSLESCQRGLLDGLKELGFVEGQNLTVRRTHAQGEMVNIPQMIQNMDSTEVEAMVTFSTPVLQTAMSMAKRKPVVFTYVTDPLAAGAGKSYEDHLPHLTGIGSLPPIEDTVQMIRRTLPHVKRIGTIYNNSEANSVKIVTLLRESTKRANLELVELTAASSNEVLLAMQALTSRGIDGFYMVSDNTAYLAFEAILKVADSAKLPVIVDDPDYLAKGAVFVCGPGYYHSGKAAAPLLARVLLGESPAGIPMANVSVNTTKFNPAAIAKLGLQIDPALIRELEDAGTTKAVAATPVPAPPPAANPNPTGKKWKIAYILYNETPPAEQTLDGMKERWAKSPLVAGKDYEIKIRSAQGDMSALGGLIDAAVTDGADIIVPLSTPTLQVAVQKVKRTPVLFTLIANPMAAGAGRSYADHVPNVSGIAVLAPFNEALDRLQKYFPTYRRLGTLYCPAEANSVDLKESLEAACKARGLTLEVVAANTAGEMPDAALSLMSRPIDCVLQLSDNLTSSGFTALTRAARQSRIPLFSLNTTTVALGSAWALGRDYQDAGEATVAMLERVIRGDDIAKMPFELPPRVAMKASDENARLCGFTLPPALLAEVAASQRKSGIAAPAPTAAKTSAAPVAPKKWKIATILYNETPPAEEILAGMKDAWARSSFREGRDYEVKVRSAQGDMALLNGIVDAALTDGADLIVALSTPTLQVAATKVKRVPVVFSLVTNPMAAGAAKSYTDHIPNITGIAVLAPMGEALDLIKRHYPNFKRIGTLYCPAEANAVYLKEALDEACRQRGFTLETVAANSATDLPDAATALMARPIDVVLQIPDALSSTGFSAITRAARQRQMPLMALNSTVVPQGAAIGLGRDFHNAGEATVALIERIFRGEKPADIPIALPPKISAVASRGNAQAVGLALPPELLKEMEKVVD